MATELEIQQRLHALALYNGALDGEIGPQTLAAISKALDKIGAAMPPVVPPVAASGKFDAGSAKRLKDAHPLLQQLMNAAREKIPFQILDSQRGREAQEKAFNEGHSKAHFGQSAHNWSPAIAVDITPVPLNWHDIDAFVALSRVILPLAKQMAIPIEWGGNWKKLKDMPHYELTGPEGWRGWAKSSKPFKG